MRFYKILLISLLFGSISCTKHEKITESNLPAETPVNENAEKNVTHLPFKFSDLKLYQNLADLNLNHFKKYGKFYTSDFVIYQIGDLADLEENNYIQEIYLYFIDSTLLKIQAVTRYNMTDQLLHKNGRAKMILLDKINKKIAHQEGVVKHNGDKAFINHHLTRYKLIWDNNLVKMTFLVDEPNITDVLETKNVSDQINTPRALPPSRYVLTMESQEYSTSLQKIKLESLIQ